MGPEVATRDRKEQTMARAGEAREWAQTHLRGIADSLITPFSGEDGDEIDYAAYRQIVRYCLGDLNHDGLWITSGLAEWWSLTMDERKKLVEVTVEEARKIKPSAFIQACTVAMNAKDTVELTRHAQDVGADICYLQNPVMEAHGGPGMLGFFKYVADRTDIALGMFNSPSSGYDMTAAEIAHVADEIPAMCAIKDASNTPGHGMALASMAPRKLVAWDVSGGTASYLAGYVQLGFQAPCVLGGMAYLTETPSDKRYTDWFNLVLEGKLEEAREYYFRANVDGPGSHGLYYTEIPERPRYLTHFGSTFKYCAQLVGLPVGDYPHSRPPQIKLTDDQKGRIKAAYVNSGLLDD
jgi:4-hydroxy-tetrahydrodipicolinate synthase